MMDIQKVKRLKAAASYREIAGVGLAVLPSSAFRAVRAFTTPLLKMNISDNCVFRSGVIIIEYEKV